MSPARLKLERLAVRHLRNLVHVELEAAPRLNVISGCNGHGKTSLLEAIYLAATSRSFRTKSLAELVAHGAEAASVRASFVEEPSGEAGADSGRPRPAREQTAAIDARGPCVRIDGNRPASLVDFATRSPVIAFHPGEITLSTGPANGRRTLLDRIALFLDPRSADHRLRYARALRERQRLLRSVPRASLEGHAELDVFEQLCAAHGASLTRSRRAAAEALSPELVRAFGEVAAPGLLLGVRYAPGGAEEVDAARLELSSHRGRDARRSSAGFGPHRDDLELSLDGHPVRTVASQGQHRALTLALKAAETATIAALRGLDPILLLDDVSSELDAERTSALFAFLARTRGQIFLTTTRRDLIAAEGLESGQRRDFQLSSGSLERL